MTDKFKSAFDSIKADESLKTNTMAFLRKEIQAQQQTQQQRQKTRRHPARMRLAGAFLSAMFLFFSGAFSYSLYFTSQAFVDVDINPSIELVINRFDRVIDVRAYNEDGGNIISGLKIKHKNYQDALLILMEEINRKGYIQSDGLISVTLQTDDANRENQMLSEIETGVTGYMSAHHSMAQVDIFPVSGTTRADAYELEVSPAKYIAIQELIEVDPYATMESCRGHSVRELKQLTQDYKNGYHDREENQNHNTVNHSITDNSHNNMNENNGIKNNPSDGEMHNIVNNHQNNSGNMDPADSSGGGGDANISGSSNTSDQNTRDPDMVNSGSHNNDANTGGHGGHGNKHRGGDE